MKEYGLVGYPLGHSYSQKYFTEKFKKLNITDSKYSLFPISEISKINNIIESHKNLLGLNVTTPYKELIIPFIHTMDEMAMKIGNVNTVKIIRNGQNYNLKGYNTDFYGFKRTLQSLNLPLSKNKALILGSGGSAKTVSNVFHSDGIDYSFVTRNKSRISLLSYQDLNKSIIEKHNIIVNATPVGMYPNIINYPDIPYDYITKDHFVIDLVYNPEETLFLNKCKEKNATTVNGLSMLYSQADKAWDIWNS